MPIGALVASRELMELFSRDPMLGHITTFGGHPVVCAAAHAALNVLLRDAIVDQVEEKGQRLAKGLLPHPAVKAIRQRGLFLAVDLENADAVQSVVSYCLEHGLIGFWFLSNPHSFRLAPPLVITDAEIDQAIAIIRRSLDALSC